jgi:hypothetical protein
MGTNWFMPALVNNKFGASGIRLEDGTMACCLDLKKSRKDCRISVLVIAILMEIRCPRAHSKISNPAGKRQRKFRILQFHET